jgi:hypothetical protein
MRKQLFRIIVDCLSKNRWAALVEWSDGDPAHWHEVRGMSKVDLRSADEADAWARAVERNHRSSLGESWVYVLAHDFCPQNCRMNAERCRFRVFEAA